MLQYKLQHVWQLLGKALDGVNLHRLHEVLQTISYGISDCSTRIATDRQSFLLITSRDAPSILDMSRLLGGD